MSADKGLVLVRGGGFPVAAVRVMEATGHNMCFSVHSVGLLANLCGAVDVVRFTLLIKCLG